MTAGVHTLIQSVFDEKAFDAMIDNGKKTKIEENALNDNFYKEEFQTLWNYINHKYVYTVKFDSNELIEKAVQHIDQHLKVTELQYTLGASTQKSTINLQDISQGESFNPVTTQTKTLEKSQKTQSKYDLVGKIAVETLLTRKTVVEILKKISDAKFILYQVNPEDFISKVIRLIKDQKATMVVDSISYNQIDEVYESSIFTVTTERQNFEKAFKAQKSIQDYVITDGMATQSVERRFVEELDHASEVCVYAKLPRGFSIPTPVGNYSPDWAIAFHKGSVKHIFFVAETKGSMNSLEIRPVEGAKIKCAKKLFNNISSSHVKYHDVDSYQTLLNIISSL